MIEPTARDLLVCVEMNNARIRGPDGASARVLAAYREELLAASAQSAEPQEEEVLLDIRHRLYAEAVERSVGWSAWTPNEAYKTGFEGGIDATFDILRARLAMKRHLAAPAQSAEPQEAEALLILIEKYIEDASSAASFVVRNTEKHAAAANSKGLKGADWTECAMDSYAAMNFNCRSQDARDALDSLRARLDSKPSRPEAEAILQGVYDAGLRQGKWLVQNTAPNAPVYMQPSMDSVIEQALDALSARPSREEGMREALTPSANTKAAYIGEFKFNIPDTDDDGYSLAREVVVPWTTIKEIMAAILARTALAQGGARDEGKK
jgi:hypothetical protein